MNKRGFEFSGSLKMDKSRIFLVNLSDVENRLDPDYYAIDLPTENLIRLDQIIHIKGGKRIPKGMGYTSEDSGYKYFRISDVVDNSIDIENLRNIDKDVFDILQRYELNHHDIIFSIAGTIGNVYLFEKDDKHRVILTENCAKIIIKKDVACLVQFLEIVLNLKLVQKQIARNFIQTTIPKLGLDKIASLRIPKLPDLEFQATIIEKYQQAKKLRQEKLSQAQQLSDGIQTYLLAELSIDIPKMDNSLNKRIFTVQMSEIGERLDPSFYFYLGHQMNAGQFENQPLGNLANLMKGTSLNSDKVIDGNYPVIAGGQTSPYNHHVYNFSGENITVSASGYAGYVWFHDYPIFASDCTVIHSKNEELVLTKYLFELMKLKQEEIYRLRKGAVQPHVYAVDLAKIQIPLPPIEQQQKIVAHIAQIRQQIADLQNQAQTLLNDTQSEIEQLILG